MAAARAEIAANNYNSKRRTKTNPPFKNRGVRPGEGCLRPTPKPEVFPDHRDVRLGLCWKSPAPTEAGPDGRIDVGQVNIVFLREGGEAYEYRAGIALLKRDGLIDMHDSGTFFRFTEKGAQWFA